MLIEEKVDGIIFLEQTTFYIYASEEDRKKGKYIFVTSDEGLYLSKKNELKSKLSKIRGDKIDIII
jgi:hypothetical protein